MSRKPRRGPGVALFPFLAVLICTMGALIVVLVLFMQQARLDAGHVAAQVAADPQTDALAAERRAAREKIEDEQWRQSIHEKQREQQIAELSDARLKASHLDDHIRRLQNDARTLMGRAEEIDRGKKGPSQLALGQAELNKIKEEIERRKKELGEKKKNASKNSSYALIPYDGPNGTKRRPIYIECRVEGVVLHPEGLIFGPDDFNGPLGPGNPLDAALRCMREAFRRSGEQGEPYPLLVVRPSGIVAYSAARSALKGWDEEFGYELVSEDKNLEFGKPNPAMQRVLEDIVGKARQRQIMLAAAMPRKFGEEEALVSFAPEDQEEFQHAVNASRGAGGVANGNGENTVAATRRPNAGGVAGGPGGAQGNGVPGGTAGNGAPGGNGQGRAPVQFLTASGSSGSGGMPGISSALIGGGGGNGGGPLGFPGGQGGNGGSGGPYPNGGSGNGSGTGNGGSGGVAGGVPGGGFPAGSGTRGTGPGGNGGVPGQGVAGGVPGGAAGRAPGVAGGQYANGGTGNAGSNGTGGNYAAANAQGGNYAAGGGGTGTGGGTGNYQGGAAGQGSSGGNTTQYQGGVVGGTNASGSTSQGGSSAGAPAGGMAGASAMSGMKPLGSGMSNQPQSGDPNANYSGSSAPSGSAGGSGAPGGTASAPPPGGASQDPPPKRGPRSHAATRAGANWGLPGANGKSTAVTRPVRVVCLPDKLVIVPERGDDRLPITVPLSAEMQPAEAEAFVKGVQKQLNSWGPAMTNGYWKPTLQVEVTRGAEPHFETLQHLLQGSGFDIQRKAAQ